MIFDSNLIIYSSQPAYPGLRRLIARVNPAASLISKLEVLGFHKITSTEKSFCEKYFATSMIHPLTDDVIDEAIVLRRMHNMGLADSIIAATAILTGQELHTHNISDFAGIPGLIVVDPLAHGDPP